MNFNKTNPNIMRIALVGLPSSGKSSIVNSLVGLRVLQTGVCRTTSEPTLIGKENPQSYPNFKACDLISDDGIPYSILDLPGICDSTDKTSTFNKICDEHILSADIVLWASPVSSAFITDHEFTEYQRILKRLQDESVKRNKVYQIGIILTKSNDDFESAKHCKVRHLMDMEQSDTNLTNLTNLTNQTNLIELDEPTSDPQPQLEEITGSDEDTTILDSLKRVRDLNQNTYIMYYNAHGRIVHKSGSDKLKDTVLKIGRPSPHNIKFNIKYFVDELPNKRDMLNRYIFRSYYNEMIGKFFTSTLPKKRKINSGVFDFEQLFNITVKDGTTTYSRHMFDSFMQMMYDLPTSIPNKQNSSSSAYDDFFRTKTGTDARDSNYNSDNRSAIQMANTFICCMFGQSIHNKVKQNLHYGLYEFENILNDSSIYSAFDPNEAVRVSKLSETEIEQLDQTQRFRLNLLRITESIGSYRTIHMLCTMLANRTKDLRKTEYAYYNADGVYVAYDFLADKVDRDTDLEQEPYMFSLDRALSDDKFKACDLKFQREVMLYRKRLYPNETIDISMLIKLRLDGELDTLFENFQNNVCAIKIEKHDVY